MSINFVPSVMTLEALRSVPLFASLDDTAAGHLRSLLLVQDIKGNTAIFRAGDGGDSLCLIESGRVRISITDQDGKLLILAELAGGDFFGEMALIDGKPRSADATVIEDARLAVLSREDFLSFVRGNPDVAVEMISAVSHRLRRTDELLRQRVSRNINEEEEAQKTFASRMADMIAEFGGSWKFIGASATLLVSWMILNTWLLRDAAFDPSPYILLNLVLGIMGGLQAPIILMSQNRQSDKDRLRSDLDYKVNLKNELSLTELQRRFDLLENERLPLLFEEQNARLLSRDVTRSLKEDKAQ
jgi:CRP/FNR family transcriptional regulator, cyclic AMP receptor protein